jgi:cytochrome c oxidase subunit 4
MADTAATHAPHGAVEHHDQPSYIAVFIYLTLLTGAELGLYKLPVPRTMMIGGLVALALAKATLVAMYFMHLAMERKGLWIVAVTPLVIIAFCYLMLRPDLSRRAYASHPENVVIGNPEGAEGNAPPPPAVQPDAASASGANAAAAPAAPAPQPAAAPASAESAPAAAASPATP